MFHRVTQLLHARNGKPAGQFNLNLQNSGQPLMCNADMVAQEEPGGWKRLLYGIGMFCFGKTGRVTGHHSFKAVFYNLRNFRIRGLQSQNSPASHRYTMLLGNSGS